MARCAAKGAGGQASHLRGCAGHRAGRGAVRDRQGPRGILMGAPLQLGDLAIEVVHKDIKNVHLSVHPPTGRVRIAAPRHLSVDAIRAFAIHKVGWIRRQQKKLQEQEREPPREYLDRESHYVWGRRCLLVTVERDAPPCVEWRHHRLTLSLRPGTEAARRAGVLEAWYREQLRAAAQPVMARWGQRIGGRV